MSSYISGGTASTNGATAILKVDIIINDQFPNGGLVVLTMPK